jgi:hypothetical protein
MPLKIDPNAWGLLWAFPAVLLDDAGIDLTDR